MDSGYATQRPSPSWKQIDILSRVPEDTIDFISSGFVVK